MRPRTFNGGVITLDPVVEVVWRSANDGPHLAPMADLPAGSWLVVDGSSTVAAAGLFVSLLAEREDLGRDAGAAEAVAAVVKADTLILPGGLRVTDTMPGKSVVPGCCAGLEAWRDWVELLERRQPWMGHDPGPWVEFRAGRVRVWQDGQPDSPRRGRRNVPVRVELPESELPGLLLGVQRALSDFLSVLYQWAEAAGIGAMGIDLVTAVDRAFAVGAPLRLPPA